MIERFVYTILKSLRQLAICKVKFQFLKILQDYSSNRIFQNCEIERFSKKDAKVWKKMKYPLQKNGRDRFRDRLLVVPAKQGCCR